MVVCSWFSNFRVSFGRLANCSQLLQLFAGGLLLVLKSLVSFERFAPRSQAFYCFRAACFLCFQMFFLFFGAICSFLPQSPSCIRLVCALFANSLVTFERFDPCSQILHFLCSGGLFVLKLSSPFRAICSLFLNSVVSVERVVPCSEITD